MKTEINTEPRVQASTRHARTGYRSFTLGGFSFLRDEYFVHVSWPARGQTLTHTLSADAFLRALMRDVGWGFFYGWVNLDAVIGTRNFYGRVELYAGRYHPAFHERGLDRAESFETPEIMATFKAILDDWTNEGVRSLRRTGRNGQSLARCQARPTIAPPSSGRDRSAGACRDCPATCRCAATPAAIRSIVRSGTFPRREPQIHAEPGFENEVRAFNLFAYLSRSDVTWNPSVTSVCGRSLCCPTTEEYILPIKHGNDRVEWFMQLSDEIVLGGGG